MVICRKKGCKREVEDYKTKRGKSPTLCLGHYESQCRSDEKKKQKRLAKNKDICRMPYCQTKINYFKTESAEKPTLCKYHYDNQRIVEKNRPERDRQQQYLAYDLTRKNNPKRIQWKHDYARSPQGYLSFYKSRCKQTSKREWKLSDEFAIYLFLGKCRYCKKEGSSIQCNGIDRIDNNIDYIESNCVSCCWICNRMKGAQSHDDFINHIRVILQNF